MSELDVAKFKIGDVFYGVSESNNAFHRKKIHREIDGEDWFKYEMPLVTYKVVTYTVLGILKKQLEGEWEKDSEYELMTEIFVKSETDDAAMTYTMHTDDVESKQYFLDKEEALDYIEHMSEDIKELDRK